MAQSTLTPDAALKALMDGNQRSVGGQPRPLNEDLSLLKAKSAEKQEPFAAVLSCAECRVPGGWSSTSGRRTAAAASRRCCRDAWRGQRLEPLLVTVGDGVLGAAV